MGVLTLGGVDGPRLPVEHVPRQPMPRTIYLICFSASQDRRHGPLFVPNSYASTIHIFTFPHRTLCHHMLYGVHHFISSLEKGRSGEQLTLGTRDSGELHDGYKDVLPPPSQSRQFPISHHSRLSPSSAPHHLRALIRSQTKPQS